MNAAIGGIVAKWPVDLKDANQVNLSPRAAL
jgi:hypothetical protein